MGRPHRIEYPGAFYHITTRGNLQSDIFLDDRDRYAFLALLDRTVGRYRWSCHAFCLMRNHYHLLVETPDGQLSQGMEYLNGVYARRFNKRHGRIGHLTQGRYDAPVIDTDEYFFAVAKYIVVNPVHAGLTDCPSGWRWSNYNSTAGLQIPLSFLNIEFTLSLFGDSLDLAQASYRDFIFSNMEGPRVKRKSDHHTFPTASDTNRKTDLTGEMLRDMKHQAGRPSLAELSNGLVRRQERDDFVLRAYGEFGYRMAEIAGFLEVNISTISRIINR